MRHALILSTALFAACAASGAAMAQSSATGAGGLRYLSWPGKPPVTQGPAPTLRRIPQPTTVAAVVNAPVTPLPLPRLSAPASTPTPRRGLTPASDWIAPAPMTTPTMTTTPQPYAAAPAAPEAAPRPVRAETVAAPAPAPAQTPVQAPPQSQPQAEAASEPAFDPMAPRRDAPIFRLQRQAAAETAPPTETEAKSGTQAETQSASAAPPAMVQAALAPVEGARFYSVHRQAGRQPDRINTVQPIYLDALPVEMTQTPSSADLAQPDGPPALLRNSDGSVRAMPQTTGDDLP